MKHHRDQAGSSLIILLGVIAALAIMATTLVALTGNVQSNTYNDRMKAKAASVTEAALDVGMYELSAKWPVAVNGGPSWDTLMPPATLTPQQAFRLKFDTTQFPNPKTGSFSAVTYFDNAPYADNDPSGTPYSAANPPNYDKNLDSRLWLRAQSGVGPAAARIQALVEITYFEASIPKGVAVFTGANLVSNTGDPSATNPKITVEIAPTIGGVAVCAVGDPVGGPGAIENAAVYDQSSITPLTGDLAGTVDQVMPPGVLQGLYEMAKDHGRYFGGPAAIDDALGSDANGAWSDGGISGLTVIEPTTPGTLRLPAKPDPTNTVEKPGIIILLGGSNLDFQSGGNYFGVLYTQGTVEKGSGTYTVHGMLVADSTVDMKGTVNVMYNDKAISNLANRFTSNVRIVENTWRELRPQ